MFLVSSPSSDTQTLSSTNRSERAFVSSTSLLTPSNQEYHIRKKSFQYNRSLQIRITPVNPIFYNYFSDHEEFLSYLKNDRFCGSGLISTPMQKEPYFLETDRKAKLELKQSRLLILLEGKESSKSLSIPLNPTETNSKERRKLEFCPDYLHFENGEEGFSVKLQPLDRKRIHLQVDSKIGLEFSGTLARLNGWKKWFLGLS